MLELTIAGIVGILTVIAGVLVKIIGFPAQIKTNYKRKSTQGLSTIFITLSFFSYFLWTLHGFFQKDFVLIIGQGIGILTTGIILIQVYSYKHFTNKT